MNNTLISFYLTTLAGFSTMIGSILIFFKTKKENIIISSSLAFASGVMFCVSITDLIPESLKLVSINHKGITICFLTLAFIVIGTIFSMLIDYYIPSDYTNYNSKNSSLYKLGIISMLAIILHNIPEGIATFLTAGKDISLGISLAIAIALHNIPEGISIAIPIYYSTNSKLKALFYTFVSAISEPFGALIAFLFLKNIITDSLMGYLYAFIAGIMLHISICEFLPNSLKYDNKKYTYTFLILGIIFMLFRFL